MGLFNRWRPTLVKLPTESGDYLITEQIPGERIINIAYFDVKKKKQKYPYVTWTLSHPYEGWIENQVVAWKKLPKTF